MNRILTLVIAIIILSLSQTANATIYGTLSICAGQTTSLTGDSLGTTGGTWTSSNPSVASLTYYSATTTSVHGVAAGTSIITYTGPSGVSTVVFTVMPVPMPISGGTSVFCAGTTTTLSSTTPGGTWSSWNPAVATVSASGIVTGVGAGWSQIYYTLGTGCSASHMVTVNAAPVVDTVDGWPAICPGATTTYTCSTTGGAWTSSNTAVATINSAGVITGIATGTSTITYTVVGGCGTGINTAVISVTTTLSAGTIAGASPILTGSGSTFYPTLPGGVWSSSNTAVATINATGNAMGIAAGTTTISYTITSGSCTPASATTLLTVNNPNCISGALVLSGAPYTGYMKVWLIKYNPSTHMLTASDSMNAYCSGGMGHYQFCGMGTDSFRVKAADDTVLPGPGYQPTYHTSSAYWHSATVINHVFGFNDINKDISIGYGATTAGPGFIAGDVTTGANKGTADGLPAPGLLIFCQDNTTGAIMQQAITDAAGHYSFSNLPVGQSYKIYPECINYATTPYPPITLTAETPAMNVASFVQHTLSYTITPIVAGVADISSGGNSVRIFPNPASGSLNVLWNAASTGNGTVVITDMAGRKVRAANMDMTTGNTLLDIEGLSKGLYLVSVKAEGISSNTKIEIQ